jgi:hypothetical protein
MAILYPWNHLFDPIQVVQNEEKMIPKTVTNVFPNLRCEYMPLLLMIASRIGVVIGESKIVGIPSKHIIVPLVSRHLTKLLLALDMYTYK